MSIFASSYNLNSFPKDRKVTRINSIMSEKLIHRVDINDTRETKEEINARRLMYYHELEEWQKDNHFIKSGYLKPTNSFKECLKALCYLHNETVNIYSHFIPTLVVMAFVVYYVQYKLEIYDNYLGVWEKLNFYQFALGATICLSMSSGFHTFKAHSMAICSFGNKLDYFGIVVLITSSLISIILFAFYDHPFYKYTFILIFMLMAMLCTNFTLNPSFSTPAYRPIRSTMFVLFGLSGLLPLAAGVHLYGIQIAIDRSSAGWLALEGFSYIFGAVIYALRVPERWTHIEEDKATLEENPKSGRFDIVGHSHQIFHFFVNLGLLSHWIALLNCYHYLHQVTLVGAI